MKWTAFRFSRTKRAALAGFASALFCVCFAGCASHGGNATAKAGGKVFAVTADKTSFFRYGPQQGNGPDETLAKDTLMTLIRPSFGYCKVQLLPSQQEGYVASEDIQPAPPTLLASLNPTTPASSSSERESFDVRTTDPNFVPPPEALPDPDLPPAAAEPSPQ